MASKAIKLFSPLVLGGKRSPVQLQHRVVMAPLTRLRTGEEGVPTDLVAEYYAQRATAGGLLIAEATNISPTACGYFGAPGLFSPRQVEGWKPVTNAVHDKGGKIFVQLWHTHWPVSASAIGMDDVKGYAFTREGKRDYVTPRAKNQKFAVYERDASSAASTSMAAPHHFSISRSHLPAAPAPPTMTSKALKLFSPLTLGGKKNPVQLQHGVVMAPLTRLRTGEEGIPTDLVAEYYAQRTTPGGLLIAEATNISPTARGYFGSPGLFTAKQVEAWKSVTRAVHDKGGKIFVQLWHTGRVGHPLNQPNEVLPVSSSAVGMEDVKSSSVTPKGRRAYVTPRALETQELAGIVADYKRAAENAIIAGFDGVELHGANGYLLEQFLCDNINQRTGAYGGSIENRARLMLEALEAVLSSLDSSQVAIRLSPFGVTFGCSDSTPAETYGYVIKQLNTYDLAYLHIVEPRGFHFTGPRVPEGGTTMFCRPLYKGVLMTSSGFDRAEGIKVTESGTADCVAYGRAFISNPDFVHRLKIGAPENAWDRRTFYMPKDGPLSLGYTDYPALDLKSSL